MARRRLNAKDYSEIPRQEKDETDGFRDEQFYSAEPRSFPWKTVGFVMGFMIVGAICLTLGIIISTGHLDRKYDDRAWPLLILGIIMFIPGGYYGYICICICLKRDGFTLEDIPIL